MSGDRNNEDLVGIARVRGGDLVSAYHRHHWIAYLAQAERWDLLRIVLTEVLPVGAGEAPIQPWFAARFAVDHSPAVYLADLDILWEWAEAQEDLALCIRCALLHASVRGQSDRLAPELLAALVTVGMPEGAWSASAALHHINSMCDSVAQVHSLARLAVAGVELPWPQTLAVALAIPDVKARLFALLAVAPQAPSDLQETLLKVILAILRATNIYELDP